MVSADSSEGKGLDISQQETLLQKFLHWEKNAPDDIYMTQPRPDGSVVDYGWAEVGDQARRMASHLRSLGLHAGSHIAILSENCAHWIMADLAIWMAGHVSVPIDPSLSGDAIKRVLVHSEAGVIFIGKTDFGGNIKALIAAMPEETQKIGLPLAEYEVGTSWNELIAAQGRLMEFCVPEADSLATIIYTAESTGLPKGVMHSHRGMVAFCGAIRKTFGINRSDRLYSYFSMAHTAERALIEAASLYSGARIFFKGDDEKFIRDLKRANPTIFFAVPRVWKRLYLAVTNSLSDDQKAVLLGNSIASSVLKKMVMSRLGLRSARIVLNGSAALEPNIVAWFRNVGLEFCDVYGMSENFATSHMGSPGQVGGGYIGGPMPGVSARISACGELEVKSPAQMLGYYKMPKASAEQVTGDGYFKTGDCGEIDKDGRLRLVGRIKELFKTNKGRYVAPVPIERMLSGHLAVENVCVMGEGLAQPFALITLSKEARFLVDAMGQESIVRVLMNLMECVNSDLEAHERLAFFVIMASAWTVGNGYLTPEMKVRRSFIEERYRAMVEAWAGAGRSVVWEGSVDITSKRVAREPSPSYSNANFQKFIA